MAHKLDLADISEIFYADEELSEEENELIGKFDRDYIKKVILV